MDGLLSDMGAVKEMLGMKKRILLLAAIVLAGLCVCSLLFGSLIPVEGLYVLAVREEDGATVIDMSCANSAISIGRYTWKVQGRELVLRAYRTWTGGPVEVRVDVPLDDIDGITLKGWGTKRLTLAPWKGND